MNVATGEVITQYRKQHTAADVLAFFKKIDRTVPRRLDVHVAGRSTSPPGGSSTWTRSSGTDPASCGSWGSIHTGAVRAYDLVRMLQRDGHPIPLGEAIARHGRIFKSLHILALIDNEAHRRDIKGIRNLQEGRHDLAQKIFHGRKGELHRRYHAGMEDQLGALGLVLNCVVLWNTG